MALAYGTCTSMVGTLGLYTTVYYVCGGDWGVGSKWNLGMGASMVVLGAAGIPAQNGENCFVADTPELFAQSIEWLMTDQNLTKQMGVRARTMVKTRYNSRSTISEMEQVLKEGISRQS